ncbi:hypothetical protein TYRP_012011 [Tyrophagus putrescentiae]|nr:hypothetical protein TYRP_012011 [Tyrophagus putrescentiae]
MAQITSTSGTPCDHSKDDWSHLCDGTVLNDDTILTSRTCVQWMNGKLEKLQIRVGGVHHDQMAACFKVRKAFGVQDNPLANVGLIKLEGKIDFEKLGKKVAPVCLTPKRDTPISSRCVVPGWGKANDPKHNWQLMEKEAIAKEYKGMYLVENPTTCWHDDGSPLYCPVEGDENNFLQFGISSYVYKPGTPDEPFIDFELDCSQFSPPINHRLARLCVHINRYSSFWSAPITVYLGGVITMQCYLAYITLFADDRLPLIARLYFAYALF